MKWITTNYRKFLKTWEYQTILPVSLETCMQVKKQQSEPCVEELIGSRAGQGCLLPPCLFNLYVEHIMRNARLDELQAGIKIGGTNINNLKCVDNATLMAESKEELKNLLMKVKEESGKIKLV